MEKRPPKKKNLLIKKLILRKKRSYFIENLAMLLDAGINPAEGLRSLKQEYRSKTMRRLIDEVIYEVEGGSPLWECLQKTGILGKYSISLIKLGEESGRLTENLQIIIDQQQKQERLKKKINSAAMYPVMVLSVAVLVSIGVVWFILPRLTRVFLSLDMELPALTAALIKLGEYLDKYGYIIIPLFLLFLGSFVYFIFFSPKTKFIGEYLLLKVPAIRKLIRQIELSRFGNIMGGLLQAGLPLDHSLTSLQDITTSRAYKKIFRSFLENVKQGDSFQKIFHKNPKFKKYIPIPIQQMIVFGEQSGSLERIFTKIGRIEEEKADNTAKNLSVLLEPVLLILVWAGVVTVALAVILPIYSLVGGFNVHEEAGQMTSSRGAQQGESMVVEIDTPFAVTEDRFRSIMGREKETAPNADLFFQEMLLEKREDRQEDKKEESEGASEESEEEESEEEESEGEESEGEESEGEESEEEESEEEESEGEESEGEILKPDEGESEEEISESDEEEGSDDKKEEMTQEVRVLSTEVGYLNVREGETTDTAVIERVAPGDRFPLISTTTYWYQIELPDGDEGWVYRDYVEIVEQEEESE